MQKTHILLILLTLILAGTSCSGGDDKTSPNSPFLTRLATLPLGSRITDVWGYVDAETSSGVHIVDVSDPENPQLLSSISTPFVEFHHSGWPTEDGNYLFICNELTVHPEPDITIWDIRDLRKPKFVADYKDPNNKVHNLYIIGNFAFVSYYNAGTGQRFEGAFGVYPFAPSGNIYVSDVTTGLHLFSFNADAASTAKIVAP